VTVFVYRSDERQAQNVCKTPTITSLEWLFESFELESCDFELSDESCEDLDESCEDLDESCDDLESDDLDDASCDDDDDEPDSFDDDFDPASFDDESDPAYFDASVDAPYAAEDVLHTGISAPATPRPQKITHTDAIDADDSTLVALDAAALR
jgi:hypothetical protein